jgi:hypothetical protein
MINSKLVDGIRRARVARWALLFCATVSFSPANAADPAAMAVRVLSGLDVGADRADVRACLAEQMAASTERADEIRRLDDVLAWIKSTKPQSQVADFQEILARFNHERRIDGAHLTTLTDGKLVPRHVSTYARVQRALGSGHDPKRVMCGL